MIYRFTDKDGTEFLVSAEDMSRAIEKFSGWQMKTGYQNTIKIELVPGWPLDI